MITARCSSQASTDVFSRGGSMSNVGLLERVDLDVKPEYKVADISKEENLQEAKARMQQNLDKLLNYDRYSESVKEEMASSVATAEPVVEQQTYTFVEDAFAPVKEDDIRPTSTTMQFGEADVDQMFDEMESKETAKQASRITGKSKLVIVLYSLAVAIVLALIAINTGFLSGAYAKTANLTTEYQVIKSDVDQIFAEVAERSTEEYVSSEAVKLGMIK